MMLVGRMDLSLDAVELHVSEAPLECGNEGLAHESFSSRRWREFVSGCALATFLVLREQDAGSDKLTESLLVKSPAHARVWGVVQGDKLLNYHLCLG